MYKNHEYSIQFTKEWIIINGREFTRSHVERIIDLASDPKIKNVVDDGFAGMGGVTAGFEQLEGWIVISCINHWDTAIETHQKNHPDCLHLLEDFRTADISILLYMHQEIKKRNPSVKFHLWLSLECTNFSLAKGGMSRDADSRTLADHADRYVEILNPDVVWIENVKEFKLWGGMIPKCLIGYGKKKKVLQYNPDTDDAFEFFGPMIANGMSPYCPLVVNEKEGTVEKWMIVEKKTMGRDYKRWKKHICSFGYDKEVGERLLNCADYGIPQHRIRLIMQFNREGIKPMYPQPTHHKKGKNGLPFWNPVRPCLDLDDEGESVLSFELRKSGKNKGKLMPRIESEKTIDRLIAGCKRHVLSTGEPNFFQQGYTGDPHDKSPGIDTPSRAITATGGNLYLAKAHMIDHYFGNGYMKSINVPANTVGTTEGNALHTVQFLGTYHSISSGSHLLGPCPAIMTKDKYPLFTAKFIDEQYTTGQKNKSVNEPSSALLQHPKQKPVTVHLLMDSQYQDNNGHRSRPLSKTCGTITANRKSYYLVNFQWYNAQLRSIDKESYTIIARQDKQPNYLITLETGELAIEIFEHDPPHYVKLKKFMAENGIIAINMRMLKEVEMLRIMTIPENSKMSKNSTDNKKMIGNAVPSDLIIHLGLAYDKQAA